MPVDTTSEAKHDASTRLLRAELDATPAAGRAIDHHHDVDLVDFTQCNQSAHVMPRIVFSKRPFVHHPVCQALQRGFFALRERMSCLLRDGTEALKRESLTGL